MKAVSVTWSVGASVMKKIKQGITRGPRGQAILRANDPRTGRQFSTFQ